MIETKLIVLGIGILIILSVGVFLLFPNRSPGEKDLKQISITNKENKEILVKAEIVRDQISMMRGLMGRKELPENQGMLFVFPNEDYHTFWMMNTTIKLEALHFSKEGELVDIVKMEPCKSLIDCPKYSPKTVSKYVLEVNQGFSETNKFEIGKSKIKVD